MLTLTRQHGVILIEPDNDNTVLSSKLIYTSTRVYAQTHVFKISVCKGSQWALLNLTVGYAYVSMGNPRVQGLDSLIYGLTYL